MTVIPPLIRPLVDPLGRPLSGGGLPWEGGGGAAPSPYSPAASAIMLPGTAIWISTSGLTLAAGDTTVDSWLAGWGGVRPTLTAPAATNRPAYTPAAVPVLTFDGTDNCLGGVMTKGSAFTSWEGGFVGSRVAVGTAGDLAVGYLVGGINVMGLSDNSAAAYRAGAAAAGNAAGTTDPDGVTAHWSGYHPGGTDSNRFLKNGAVETTGSAGALTSRADGGVVCIGGNSVGLSAFGNNTYQAAYWGPALTADQRTYLRALLTYYTGVAS